MIFETKTKWIYDPETDEIMEADVLYKDGTTPIYYNVVGEHESGIKYIYDELICDSKEDAENRRKVTIDYAKAMAQSVRENIEELGKYSETIVAPKEYIPARFYAKTSFFNELSRLRNYIQTGMINMCGVSFQKKDVVSIQWGSVIIVHLKDGWKLKTEEESEKTLLQTVFGKNYF